MSPDAEMLQTHAKRIDRIAESLRALLDSLDQLSAEA
jgi:hypothetical protein